MSIITEETDILKTAIRVIKIEKFQRFCLKCGKILPTKINKIILITAKNLIFLHEM